jgi:hypothetical protein
VYSDGSGPMKKLTERDIGIKYANARCCQSLKSDSRPFGPVVTYFQQSIVTWLQRNEPNCRNLA